MPKRLLVVSRTQPARAILGVVAIITFLSGLWLFTPWYVAASASPIVAAAFSWPTLIAACVNTAVAVPALVSVYRNTACSLARGAFGLFSWFLFVTASRIVLSSPATLGWVTTLIIALVMAVVFVEQSAQVRRDSQ